MVNNYFVLITIVSTIWVYADAVSKGIGKSAGIKDLPYNLPPFVWALLTFIAWFIGLPIYLFLRGELIRRAKADEGCAGIGTDETFGSAAGRSGKIIVGALLTISGVALAMFGFDLIDRASGKAGGGLAVIISFALLVLPGLPIALIGVRMVISELVKAKRRQSKNNKDVVPSELD